MFCRAMMLAFLVDQTTIGLHAANQATGKIGTYSLIMFTPKILIVFIAWFVLAAGLSVNLVMAIYVGIELLVAIMRLPYLKITTGLHIIKYIKEVLLPLIPLIAAETFCGGLIFLCADGRFRFLLNITVCAIIGVVALIAFTLNKEERTFIHNIVLSKLRK